MRNLRQLPSFSAIIFEMDGLVLDTESSYFMAWKRASIEMGFHFTEDFCHSMSGLHYKAVEKKLRAFCGNDFDLTLFNRLSGKYWRDTVSQQGIAVKKGFFKLLNIIKAKNIPTCLATNSHHQNTLECLQLAKISDVFQIIVTRDHVKQGKPAPDIFLLAAELLQVQISQCLVLEDSKTGVEAAVSAGANTIFIPSQNPFELEVIELANYFFNDMDELAQIIQLDQYHPV